MLKFVDRKREIQALSSFYQAPEAGLMILFGRRRVGKTRLLTYFLETQGVPGGLYWTATTHGAAYQLRDFSQALFRYDPRFSSPPSPDFSFPDWGVALDQLAQIAAQFTEPQFIVLDEFTHLIRNDTALTSIFQKAWDHRLAHEPKIKLVLTGSLVGMMEREVISYEAPLYGRATALVRLRPLPYASLLELFADRTPAERVAIYAVTGGVPAYLELFTRARTFVDALHEQCLGSGSIMLTDPALILHEQLREPQTFESILSVIASGFHRWGEIARMAGIAESSLAHYLKILQELELIERRDPVLARPGGRRGLYHVRDHFLRFYYRFIVPHISAIERGYLTVAVDRIYEHLRAFIGTCVFEELCREWVWAAAAVGELEFNPEIVGAFWRQQRGKGVQLDVVAANRRDKRLLIGEAKWGRDQAGRQVLLDLVERSRRMPQVAEGWPVEYVVFAREGFTKAAQETADQLGARLVSLSDIEACLVAAN
ncbi:MAG: ATP-binding protein [Anaerolineales bacterium]|nr:ATP-binding protein [Anaerolineales bacterium]